MVKADVMKDVALKILKGLGHFKGEEALNYVWKETQKTANRKQAEMHKLAKLPFAYTIYRLGVKKHIRSHFPDEGFQPKWVRCDGREIQFNLHPCIYAELTHAHGCPELCCVFSENDNLAFSGLLPKIHFERTGTVESGASYCAFRFTKA